MKPGEFRTLMGRAWTMPGAVPGGSADQGEVL